MKKFALIALTGAALVLAALLLMRMAPRREDLLRGAEVVRVVRRDLERVVTATGVIKPRVGAEVRNKCLAPWRAGETTSRQLYDGVPSALGRRADTRAMLIDIGQALHGEE